MKIFRFPSDDETSVKPYVIRIIIFISIITVIIITSLFVNTPYYIKILFLIIFSFSFYQIFFGLISISFIKEQKNELKLKYKYHVKAYKSDILFWVEYSEEPDDIIVDCNGEKTKIDIKFDYEGGTFLKDVHFIDKGIFINKKEYSQDDAIDYLENNLDEIVFICYFTENNDPKLFLKMLKEMKNK